MATTVHVQNLSHETTDKEIKDFFSFCGKITNLSVTPTSAAADSPKSATVTFEKDTAAKTALLLDNTQLGKSQVSVSTASTIDEVATKAGAAATSAAQTVEDHLSQEDKPRSRIFAEYLAHGYVLSDQAIEKAIALDGKHGFSNKFTSALSNFDSKYKATDKAKSMDDKYGVTNTATNAWSGLNSYFEKALETPTGQKLRDFYNQGDRQVRDVHTEARRLADLKSGKQFEAHQVPGTTDKTACGCGGADGVCGCVPGKCTCANCSKSSDPSGKTAVAAGALNAPESVSGTDKTVCSCGGEDGVCGCPPGQCACASCSKATVAATSEVKEAAQHSGQQLPKETFSA